LRKAEEQARERGIPLAELLEARLAPPAPDTLNLASQVHWAAEGAKKSLERLLGDEVTTFVSPNDDAKTFAELYQRIDAVIALLQTILPSDVEASMPRALEVDNRRGTMQFKGDQFLLEFSLPHFFFHFTCAYTILRNRGIHLTMSDFLGQIGR
jgi:uncharacterized protein